MIETISATALAKMFDQSRSSLRTRGGRYKDFQVCAGWWVPRYESRGHHRFGRISFSRRFMHYELVKNDE